MLVFCKKYKFLLSSLPNMLIDSVSHWVVVGGSLGKWSVVGWKVGRWCADLMKPRKKHVWRGDFACAI